MLKLQLNATSTPCLRQRLRGAALRDGSIVLLLSILLSCAPAGPARSEGAAPPSSASAQVQHPQTGLVAQAAEPERRSLGQTQTGSAGADLKNGQAGSGSGSRQSAGQPQRRQDR